MRRTLSKRTTSHDVVAVRMLLALMCISSMILFKEASSFAPPATSKSPSISKTSIFSVENWVSGVIGSPPSKPLLTKELEKSLTAGTSLQDKELACVYKASKDGWSAIDFHKCADGKGSALVVALSRSGQVFGGFNPLGWRSTDDYYQSNAAFLWFESGQKATRLPILTGGTYYSMI